MDIKNFSIKGIDVCLCESDKFNSAAICLAKRVPLKRETVSPYALIPRVLSRAGSTHPSLRAINAYLEELGGAEFVPQAIKKGEEQIISLYLAAPKEHTGRLFELLSTIFYRPLIIDGGFMPSYVHNACSNAARDIAEKINDKRSYAAERMIEIMCRDEPFGICGDGYTEDFGDISGKGLYTSYNELLSSGITQLYIVGNITRQEAESYIANHFEQVSSSVLQSSEGGMFTQHKPNIRIEESNTAQSCLVCGIRTCGIPHPQLLTACEVLGGSAASRLFSSVREEKGMCYYINSQLYRYKGIISVQAGIDADNAQTVVEMLEKELASISKHGAHSRELERAKEGLISSLMGLEDSPRALMDFMLSLSVAGEPFSLQSAIDDIAAVDSIKGVFDNAFIDTVYLLKEGANG